MLPNAQRLALQTNAAVVSLDSKPERITKFIARTFGLNTAQQADLAVTGYLGTPLEEIVSELTAARQSELDGPGTIPSFVIAPDIYGVTHIIGLRNYLRSKKASKRLINRVHLRDHVRVALASIGQGHFLEAVAAAILNASFERGSATRGSGDQGIDFIGVNPLIPVDPIFLSGFIPSVEAAAGAETFIMGSSKHARRRTVRKVLNPVFIRELIGSWIIQRSEVRLWRRQGVRMLSPVQMVLVTTYKLSVDSRRLCSSLGVQVWNLPELVLLVCETAPEDVFFRAGTRRFVPAAFQRWWRERHLTRLAVPALPLV